MQWASQVTSISLTMALPALFGYWLDGKWGTTPWLVIVGALLGLVTGMRSLIRLADASGRKKRSESAGRDGGTDSGDGTGRERGHGDS